MFGSCVPSCLLSTLGLVVKKNEQAAMNHKVRLVMLKKDQVHHKEA